MEKISKEQIEKLKKKLNNTTSQEVKKAIELKIKIIEGNNTVLK